MRAQLFAQPSLAGNRSSVSNIIIKSLEEELAEKKALGFSLAAFFFLLWVGTLLLWVTYPWLLAGLDHLQHRICN